MKRTHKAVDKERIKKAVKEILIAIGEDPEREGLKKTPERVSKLYADIFGGYSKHPEDILTIYFEKEQYDELILLKNIFFYSMCEHHMLPFFGKIHIAYIPNKKRLLGISKLARLIDLFSKRLQLQERLTKHLADSIMEFAKPLGVMVIVEAEHLCLSMRGVKKPGSIITTSCIRGVFLKDLKTRSEALELIKR